jgi:formylglycine-generating enzyme
MAVLRRTFRRWLTASVSMLVVVACRDDLVLGERIATVPDASTGASATGGSTGGDQPGTGGSVSGGSAGTPPCPGTGGPAMVRLPEGYCIDSTEVTMRQYQDWLDTNPSTAGQETFCAGNAFELDANCVRTDPAYPIVGHNEYPVVCVDWCDARAYCSAVHKRLCGRIGGGSETWEECTTRGVSQWHGACTSGGTNSHYVYGNGFNPDACNGAYNPDAGTYAAGKSATQVGTMPGCQSSVPGYQRIFDLSGNVWEWEDACSVVDSELRCAIRGGSFRDGTLDCYHVGQTPPGQTWGNIGFRCCS